MTQLTNSSITSINNTIGTTPSGSVIGVNPTRTSLSFHVPGAIDIYVAPLFVLGSVNNQPSNIALSPGLSNLGGCFHIFAGAILTFTGPAAAQGYQAFAASGSSQSLTIVEGYGNQPNVTGGVG